MKTIQQFPHEKFLEENNIDSKALPEMLYKRIQGFEELKGDLEHTTDEDKENLLNKLETLSHELDEDLEGYFEDHLENNDREEDEQPEIVQEPVQEEPVLEKESEVVEQKPEIKEEEAQSEPTPEPLEEPAPEPQEETPELEPTPEPEPEPVKEPTDEEILEELLADKKHTVLPAELKKKGFKTDLNGKRLLVGKFCLHKGKYDTFYKIHLEK